MTRKVVFIPGGYTLAVFSVAVCFLFRLLLDPLLHNELPFAFFLAAMVVTNWRATLGPSLLALALSLALVFWCFIPPRYRWGVADASAWMAMAEYLFIGLIMCWYGRRVRMSSRHLRESADRIHAQQDQLVKVVAERTLVAESLRTLIESIPNLVWTALANGSRDYVNSQWTRYLGLSERDCLDVGWTQAIHPDDHQRVLADWKHAVQTGEAFHCEHRLRRHDGNYRWFKDRALPVRNGAGQVVKWFGTCTDVTEIAEAREVLARSKIDLDRLIEQRTAELRETIEELEQFSYALTHDLRSPLRAMQGYASFIEEEGRGDLPSRSQDYLRRIQASAQRMDALIRDALQFNEVLRQQIPLQPIELTTFISDLIGAYPDLSSHRTKIRFAGLWPQVMGNDAALGQCFSNLLRNALTFVAPSVTPEVRVWGERRDMRFRIWIQDNGIGIIEAAQRRLFGMFQRHSSQSTGTGMGLAITRKAVERMGGSVGVESEPGKGSRFWVELQMAESPFPVREDAAQKDSAVLSRTT